MQAEWHEPVDDLSVSPQPVIHRHRPRRSPNDRAHATVAVGGRHEFHDTKHRKVDYTAIATTRFREYFPAAVTADPANLTRKSQPGRSRS